MSASGLFRCRPCRNARSRAWDARHGRVKGTGRHVGPRRSTLDMFEDYLDLRDRGVGHEDAVARMRVKRTSFERACHRWPEWAPR